MINKRDKQQATTACIRHTYVFFPEVCPAPTGLVIFSPIPQSVALGWYTRPFRAGINFVASLAGNFVAFVEGDREADG